MKTIVKYMIPLCMNIYCTKALAFFYTDIGVGRVFTDTLDSTAHSPKKLSYDLMPYVFSMSNVTWSNHFKNGFNLNIALGYRFKTRWSTEVEFLYQNVQRKLGGSYDWQVHDFRSDTIFTSNNNPIIISSKRAMLYSLLVNISYDFYHALNWSSFIGGGIGVSWLDSGYGRAFSTARIGQSSPPLLGDAFSAQLKAGLRYNFYKNICLIAEYRLLGTSKFKANWGFATLDDGTQFGSLFSTNPYKIKGIVTNALELKMRYNFC